MRRIFQCLATCVALVGAGLVASAVAQPPAKPGAEHKRLEYFVGKWTTEGKMESGPMGPGGTMTSNDTCEWYEGGFAVVCRSEGKTPMGPMKSLGIISYSPETKTYTYYGVDNSGMTMTSVPQGTVQGKAWTFTDEGMMGGQKMKSRVTITEVSPTEQHFKMEIQGTDGKWMQLMESTGKKMK
jgi:Protein of unknown function (DUF1579)